VPAMSETPTIKIIYIAGYGRSGTTLMSIALGQHPAILGAGEVTELSRHAWADNTYCSCGQPLQGCSFWSAVVGRWLPSSQQAFLLNYRKHQLHFENQLIMRAMDLGVSKKASFAQYARNTEDLFRHVVSSAGKSIIVDSSKMPSRAHALARMAGLDVHVVHMVRDGRGVAWSLAKSYARDVKAGLQRDIKPKSTLRTAILRRKGFSGSSAWIAMSAFVTRIL
jgi:Sulfotransferase family